MSVVAKLGPNNENLPDLLFQYESDIANIKDNLAVKGKLLHDAQKDQAQWPWYYDERRSELKIMLKYMQMLIDKTRAKLLVKYNENYSRQLPERIMQQYIDREDDYLTIYQLFLEVEEVYLKYDAAVEAFNKRGFAMRDVTTALQHQVHDVVL